MKKEVKTNDQLLNEIEILNKKVNKLEETKSKYMAILQANKLTEDELKAQSQRNQLLLDTTSDSYILSDTDGQIIEVNQAYAGLSGYSRDELLTMNIRELELKMTSEEVDRRLKEMVSKGKDRFETKHKKKNGQTLYIEVSICILHIAESVMLASFMRDISERKHVEQVLKNNDYLLRESQKIASLGWYILELPLGHWESSDILDSIFGIDKDFIRDINRWGQIIHPDDQGFMEDYFMNSVLKNHDSFDKEYRIVRINDQEERWVHGLGKLEFGADGNPIRMIGTIQDITVRKEAEKELFKMSMAIHNSSEVIFMTDLEGIITFVNPEFTNMYGYTSEELVGKFTPRILKSGNVPIEMSKMLWNTLLNKQSIPASEYLNRRKDNTLIDVEGSANPIVDGAENIIGFLGIQRDITKRKRTEKIQSVIYNISNAVNTTDNLENLIGTIRKELGTVIDTSNFYVALYDEASDTISLPFYIDEKDRMEAIPAGKTLSKYVIQSQKTLLANKETIKKLEKSGDLEKYGTDPEIWLGVPLKINGKVTGVLAIQSYEDEHAYNEADMQMLEFVSDQISISINRKKAEQDLRIALEKATESDRLKSTFLATMSHELRTPLNAIIGFSDIIDESLALKDIVEYASIINTSGNQLLSIVEDLFDITLIEAGEIKIRKKKESLDSILEYVYNIVEIDRHTASKDKLELKLSIPPGDSNLIINTDPVKLKQILINLLRNALKFTEEGYVEFGYELIRDQNKSEIKFYVKDTGKGIPENKLSLIFDIFTQIEDTTTRSFGGTGIGLSIAKKLSEILGGKIWVSSEMGKGSVFYFTIPYELQPGEEKSMAKEFNQLSKNTNKARKKTILIAEDDEPSFKYLEIILGQDKINPIWVNNGLKAVQACKDNADIDLVLMDINMPEMDGFEATKEIKKFRPELPIIAQTAYAVEGDKEKSIKAGCDDYISKPINKKVLITKIEQYIGK